MEFPGIAVVLLHGKTGGLVIEEEIMSRLSLFALVTVVAAAGIVAPTLAQSHAASSRAKAAARYPGLYDVAPRHAPRNSDDPAATGGGSIGYNQMIYAW